MNPVPAMNTATSDLQVLRNAMLFSLTTHRFSNRRAANRNLVTTTGDKAKLNVTKAILVSAELEKINDLLNETYSWCFERAMQSSAVRRGIYFVKRTMIGEFEKKLTGATAKLSGPDGLVEKFLATYEVCKERMKLPAVPNELKVGDSVWVADGARTYAATVAEVVPSKRGTSEKYRVAFTGECWVLTDGQIEKINEVCARDTFARENFIGGLGDLYNEGDYPTVAQLRDAFGFDHSWLALSVPDDLPEEVRQRETKKLRESFEQAQEEIRYALRAGFKEMIDHAIERLTPEPGGKPKAFKQSLVTNFREFFETFNARNLMEDSELETLVNQAKAVVNGLPRDASEAADTLRVSPDIRQDTAKKFAELNRTLDTLVIERPTRKFNFDA